MDATAVQVVWSSRRGSRQIEHLGSAHDEAELEALKAAAHQRIAAGQMELGLGLDGPGPAGPLPITASRMSHLVDALERGYRVLGFEDAAGGDDVFRRLVLARIIEPSSKRDSLRVLEEAGVAPASYRTLKDRDANRLVDQEIRQDRPPLPHHSDPSRTADNHGRRSPPRRPTPSPRCHQPRRLTCALVWPNSGLVRCRPSASNSSACSSAARPSASMTRRS